MKPNIELKQWMSFKDFKKQFGQYFAISNAEKLEAAIRSEYERSISKLPPQEKVKVDTKAIASDSPNESN